MQEFEKVAAKYGEPYRSEARYFIVTNKLVTDRATAETELQSMSQGSSEIAILAKFALAQTKESDGNLDEAARLYGEVAKAGSATVTPDIANLRLASVYDKQGKKDEAAGPLFFIFLSAPSNTNKKRENPPSTAPAPPAPQPQ